MRSGKKLEPMELAYIDVPEEFSGAVIQKLSLRERASFRTWARPGRVHASGVPDPLPRADRLP